jgi:cyclic lactone autoinducer peptide
MRKCKVILSSIIATLLLAVVSLSNGTASSIFSYQPQKPKCVDKHD